jgi:hypothetical protein
VRLQFWPVTASSALGQQPSTPDMHQLLKTSLDTVAHGDLDRVLGQVQLQLAVLQPVLDTSASCSQSWTPVLQSFSTFQLHAKPLQRIQNAVPPRHHHAA